MAVLEIIEYPNPLLNKVALPVKKFDAKLKELAQNMVETMHAANGIGLAAPQVAQSLRLIVVQIPSEDEGETPTYIVCNPKVTAKSGTAMIEEGCLSCPGFYVEVERAKEITLEGQNVDGTPFLIQADGLLSICFQHEMDHLDGKLLVNYVSAVKRNLYKNEVKKKKRVKADATPRAL